MQPLQTVLLGFGAATLIATICVRARLLTVDGAIAATLVGGIIVASGGWYAGAALITFFVTSSLLGRWRKRMKSQLGHEKGGQRDAAQVFANGGLASLAILASALFPAHHALFTDIFMTCLAEANADTWATEIGSASGAATRMITNFRPAPAGMSGAVSIPGLAAALAGSATICLFTPLLTSHKILETAISVAVAGYIGALIDSILGATVQAQYAAEGSDRLTEVQTSSAELVRGLQWVNNDLVNALSTLCAAIVFLCFRLIFLR